MEHGDLKASSRHDLEKSQHRSKFILKVKPSPGGLLGPRLKLTSKKLKPAHAAPFSVSQLPVPTPLHDKVGCLRCGCHLLTVTNTDV